MDKSLTYYIAGPMSGLPQFNIPAFDAAAAHLRGLGYTIVSPAELDSAEMRAFALASPDGKLGPHEKIAGETWGDVLARDVRIIADQVGGILVLPGWFKSRGARLEVFVGMLTAKVFGVYGEEVLPLSHYEVRAIMGRNLP